LYLWFDHSLKTVASFRLGLLVI